MSSPTLRVKVHRLNKPLRACTVVSQGVPRSRTCQKLLNRADRRLLPEPQMKDNHWTNSTFRGTTFRILKISYRTISCLRSGRTYRMGHHQDRMLPHCHKLEDWLLPITTYNKSCGHNCRANNNRLTSSRINSRLTAMANRLCSKLFQTTKQWLVTSQTPNSLVRLISQRTLLVSRFSCYLHTRERVKASRGKTWTAPSNM